jgi:hypothetical protein
MPAANNEEGDSPSTRGGIEDTVKTLRLTTFTLSGVAEQFKKVADDFRNNLNLRSASMHRVAITVGGGMFWLMAGLLIVVGILVGLDRAERSAQRRQWDSDTATLQRQWIQGTETLQREWIRDTRQIQESNAQLYLEYQKAEREARVKEQQIMDQSALLLREGHRKPSDATNGPAGNLNYNREK